MVENIKNETIDTNQQDELNISEVNIGFNEIEFVVKVLDKQFELVGAPYKTMEIVEMNMDEQQKIWTSYYLNDSIMDEWFNYFVSLAKETEGFNTLDELSIKAVFESIVDEWGFNFEPDDLDPDILDEDLDENEDIGEDEDE